MTNTNPNIRTFFCRALVSWLFMFLGIISRDMHATAKHNSVITRGPDIMQQYRFGKIRGFVVNERGWRDSGTLIRLLNDVGDSVTATRSDIRGEFEFDRLDLGDYTLRMDSTAGPDGYAAIEENVIVTMEPRFVKFRRKRK
jgi:hypothetical protein